MKRSNVKIGDLLVTSGLLTQSQLDAALIYAKEHHKKLGETLVALKYLTEDQFLAELSQQLNIPQIDLTSFSIDTKITKLLPETLARLYGAVLLKRIDDTYLVGMTDPLDIIAIDEICRILKMPIQVALIRRQDLEKHLGQIYRRGEEISGYADELSGTLAVEAEQLETLLESQQVDPPVKKFIRALFEDALQVNASDIHIEPGKDVLRLRLRVDGVLQEQILDEKKIAAAVAQHLKLMAGLNMAERRLPQDGRFSIRVKNQIFDVRLSTMPIVYGESIVMRLLSQTGDQIALDKSGMDATALKIFRKIMHKPHGVILVTGPTGSGKTTTLYSAVIELNNEQTKIITIEDPVEYKIERVNQIQVRPKIGLDFSQVLRSVLRQDPDIILVGEMRDQETASIAMRAALTGHLVLSTLHTNDASSTAIRLLDMGVPGYLVAAALEGILAQRLVRKICVHCKESYALSDQESGYTEYLKLHKKQTIFYKGRGCSYCNHTGYSGRTGIFELLVLTPEMSTLLSHQQQNEFLLLAKHALAGRTLLDQALHLAKEGVTTLSEMMRVAGGEVL